MPCQEKDGRSRCQSPALLGCISGARPNVERCFQIVGDEEGVSAVARGNPTGNRRDDDLVLGRKRGEGEPGVSNVPMPMNSCGSKLIACLATRSPSFHIRSKP